MEIFQKILVPIDGSLQSKITQEMAIFISKLFKSNVTLIHVVRNELVAFGGEVYVPRENYEPITTIAGQFPTGRSLPKTRSVFSDEIIREVTEEYMDQGQGLLDEGVSLFAQDGVSVKQKLIEGTDTAGAIINEIESEKYDLVIMGNSGGEEEEGLDLHLGSVAKKVSVSAKTPVLIVRKKNEAKKILIPVAGSPKEQKILATANTIAKAAGASAVLLHVQEKSLLKLRPEVQQIGIQILKQASSGFEGVQLEQKLVSGDPARVIIQTAEQADVDLIIMRGGGQSNFRGRFLGSVSDHVLHHSTVPVLLIK